MAQERTSSRVGFRLLKVKIVEMFFFPYYFFYKTVSVKCCHSYLSSQLVVPSVLRSNVVLCIVSSSPLTVKLEESKLEVRDVI